MDAGPFAELVRVATRQRQTERIRSFIVTVKREYRPTGKTALLIDLVRELAPVKSDELGRRAGVRAANVPALLEIAERYGIVTKSKDEKGFYVWEAA